MNTNTFAYHVVAMVGCLLGLTSCTPKGQVRDLASDFALNFRCVRPHMEVGNLLTRFLEKQGFAVLNEGDLAARLGTSSSTMHVYAVDKSGRIVESLILPPAENLYVLVLTSKPTTIHDASLEQNIGAFVSQSLNCEISQKSWGDNDATKMDLYKMKFERVRGKIEEGQAMAIG